MLKTSMKSPRCGNDAIKQCKCHIKIIAAWMARDVAKEGYGAVAIPTFNLIANGLVKNCFQSIGILHHCRTLGISWMSLLGKF